MYIQLVDYRNKETNWKSRKREIIQFKQPSNSRQLILNFLIVANQNKLMCLVNTMSINVVHLFRRPDANFCIFTCEGDYRDAIDRFITVRRLARRVYLTRKPVDLAHEYLISSCLFARATLAHVPSASISTHRFLLIGHTRRSADNYFVVLTYSRARDTATKQQKFANERCPLLRAKSNYR